ncbi:MAG: protein-glutamate O-methyltransferase CheR [Campylobacterales bacterium]|nr:protein-glutamate O-methyltransferase CheR [Campylobacterales bacterium]
MFSFFKKKSARVEEQKVVEPEDYSDIGPIASYFKNETGVTFEKQTSILKNKMMTFCKLRSISSFSDLLESVKNDKLLKQELIDYLTTNETFFYREFRQIEQLVNLVKNYNGHVEILCAPSATGEEPYSIAIALLEAGVPSNKFAIVGIDINSDAVKKAEEAIYRARDVRNLSPEIINKYFTQEGEKYVLNSSVKSLVKFKLINLFDNSFKMLGKFDFVFSRNMLIYFDKETKMKAKNILESMRKREDVNVFFGHADLF